MVVELSNPPSYTLYNLQVFVYHRLIAFIFKLFFASPSPKAVYAEFRLYVKTFAALNVAKKKKETKRHYDEGVGRGT